MFDYLRQIFTKHKQKPKIIIFAGAGLSAESGLATFRNSPNGLWNQYKISEVCDLRTWKQNIDLVNQFYSERKKEILAANPNAAHISIAQLQQELGHENVQVFTSNIDDLLERAGAKTTHIHGDIYPTVP